MIARLPYRCTVPTDCFSYKDACHKTFFTLYNTVFCNLVYMESEFTCKQIIRFTKRCHIHEKFNQAYVQVLVRPEVRSSVRQVMGRYTAEEIYSTKRPEVETAIKDETEKVLNANNVEMKTLLIRSIILPEKIKQAIEDKLEQEQAALEVMVLSGGTMVRVQL